MKRLMERLTLTTKEHDGTWFGVLSNERSQLLASSFSKSRENLERHLLAEDRGTTRSGFPAQAGDALDQMINLYEGKKTTKAVRLDWRSVSEFQKNVCQRMKEIPWGRVTSYGMIAKRISSGPRAVGTAVARNPWPLFIPCHRVVPANLEIGNYSIGGALSDYGCAIKRDLLEREGVTIEGDKIALNALWVPTGA
ncbi:MAG TPA: MGMT family protein [Candidatus Bathyarchaeia archaeon]|nr:MGMT family protein [Candidatus Bathyarchaeia archaeon]